MNNRANIMYFIEHLCDMAQRENHLDFVRMMQRDILRVVDAVAPSDGSGAANVKVVRRVRSTIPSRFPPFLQSPNPPKKNKKKMVTGNRYWQGCNKNPSYSPTPSTKSKPGLRNATTRSKTPIRRSAPSRPTRNNTRRRTSWLRIRPSGWTRGR